MLVNQKCIHGHALYLPFAWLVMQPVNECISGRMHIIIIMIWRQESEVYV